MVTFIYFPFDSGDFDYSNMWKRVFVIPKKMANNFINTMYSRKLSEKINLNFGCKNDHIDDVYVILR
jgi:hypothetical protein